MIHFSIVPEKRWWRSFLFLAGFSVYGGVQCKKHLPHNLVRGGEKEEASRESEGGGGGEKVTGSHQGKVAHLVAPLGTPVKTDVQEIADLSYHITVDRVSSHLIPVINMKTEREADQKAASLTDFTEIAVCTIDMDEEDCLLQQKNPVLFSGSVYSYLSLTGLLREILVRPCLRAAHSGTGQTACADWKHLPLPSELKKPHLDDHPEADRLLEASFREKENIRNVCQKLHKAYRDFLSLKPSEESDYAVLAKNGLILGEDHCVSLVESRFLWDFNSYTRMTQNAWKKKNGKAGEQKAEGGEAGHEGGEAGHEGGESEQEEEEKVLGVIPEPLLEMAMLSMASLSILEITGSKIGFVRKNAAKIEARYRNQVRVTLAAMMLMEIGLSTIEIVNSFQKEDQPFPLVSTLVISYTSLELMMSAREWKKESSEAVTEKINRLKESTSELIQRRSGNIYSRDLEGRQTMQVLEDIHSPFKIGQDPRISLPKMEAPKGGGLDEAAEEVRKTGLMEKFSEGFERASVVVGFVIAGLEIANILSKGGVDETLTLTASGVDQGRERLKVILKEVSAEFRLIGERISKIEKILADYRQNSR